MHDRSFVGVFSIDECALVLVLDIPLNHGNFTGPGLCHCRWNDHNTLYMIFSVVVTFSSRQKCVEITIDVA